jgi:hypothetical protein
VGVGGARRVVVRWRFVVSEDGGGGREDRHEDWEESIDARHRKHSPVPKKCGDGCGASVKYAPKSCEFLSVHY